MPILCQVQGGDVSSLYKVPPAHFHADLGIYHHVAGCVLFDMASPPTDEVPAAMMFTSDYKLGHYMKIPPVPMFFAQVCGSSAVLPKFL